MKPEVKFYRKIEKLLSNEDFRELLDTLFINEHSLLAKLDMVLSLQDRNFRKYFCECLDVPENNVSDLEFSLESMKYYYKDRCLNKTSGICLEYLFDKNVNFSKQCDFFSLFLKELKDLDANLYQKIEKYLN